MESDPRKFKADMIRRYPKAFELWGRSQKLLEDAVVVPRDLSSPLSRALDILLLQALKSHGSIYVLAVRGHGEDGATILRRLLELAFQIRFIGIGANAGERGRRAGQYLSWFWMKALDAVKLNVPPAQKQWWQQQYDAHKHLFTNSKGRPTKHWWGDCSRKELAAQIGVSQSYETDYRFLSRMAHGTTQHILFQQRGSLIEICTPLFVEQLLVIGVRYMLAIAEEWNNHFNVIEPVAFQAIAQEAIAFKYSSLTSG